MAVSLLASTFHSANIRVNLLSIEPESETEQQTSDDKHPDRSARLGRDSTLSVRPVHSGPGTDSVGNIVGAVGDGHHHRGDDLTIRPHMLDTDIITVGASVDVTKLVAVVGDDVASDTLKKTELEVPPELLGIGPRKLLDRPNETLMRLEMHSLLGELGTGVRLLLIFSSNAAASSGLVGRPSLLLPGEVF